MDITSVTTENPGKPPRGAEHAPIGGAAPTSCVLSAGHLATLVSQMEAMLAQMRKITAALDKAMPLLDNPATRWAATRKKRAS